MIRTTPTRDLSASRWARGPWGDGKRCCGWGAGSGAAAGGGYLWLHIAISTPLSPLPLFQNTTNKGGGAFYTAEALQEVGGAEVGLGALASFRKALPNHPRLPFYSPRLPHHRSAPSAAPRVLRCILMGRGCSTPSWPAAATPLWTLGRCVWGGAIRTCSVGEYDVGRYGVVRYGVGGMAWGGTGTHRGLGSLRLYLCPLAPHPCTISTWKTPPIEPHPF